MARPACPCAGSADLTNAGQANIIAANQQALGANAVVAKQTNVAGIAANIGEYWRELGKGAQCL